MVLSTLSNLLKIVTEPKVSLYAIIALGLAVAGLSTALKLSEYKYDREVAQHARDISEYKAAQAEANSLAIQTKQQDDEQHAKDLKDADAKYADLRAKYTISLHNYASAQTNSGVQRSDTTSVKDSTTESVDGPSASTNVSITEDDANICAINTARLQAAHDWALSDTFK